MAHNVSAVCDGFAVAIKERGAFQQPQNCGEAKRHKGRKPDWRFAEPEPPIGGEAHTDLLCEVALVYIFFYYFDCSFNMYSHYFIIII